VQAGIGVDAADASLDLAELVGRHQVGLVEQDDVGEGDLVLRLRRVLEPLQQPIGIGDGHDCVELGLAPIFSSMKKVCATGAGSASPVVSTMMASNLPLRRIRPSMMRTRSPRTVQQMQPLFISNTSLVGADHEVVVDADLAELVDDDGVFLAVRLGQDAVEQRGLAGAEIAGQHSDGDLVGHASLRLAPYICIPSRMLSSPGRKRGMP